MVFVGAESHGLALICEVRNCRFRCLFSAVYRSKVRSDARSETDQLTIEIENGFVRQSPARSLDVPAEGIDARRHCFPESCL